MKLSMEGLKGSWPSNVRLPAYDVAAMRERTKAAPGWIHIGAGNIFRVFLARMFDDLLDDEYIHTGLIAYESYDPEIIERAYTPYDNLTLAVQAIGSTGVDYRIVASIADAFACNLDRLWEYFRASSLQAASFTITEKAYVVDAAQVCRSPESAVGAIEQTVSALLARHKIGGSPIALVSMDNLSGNGDVLCAAISGIAEVWIANGCADASFREYLKHCTYPVTMIDKITPRPSPEVQQLLQKQGFLDTEIVVTQRGTHTAPYVNAEGSGYLIIEDNFPAGQPPRRPPLESAGPGVHLTNRIQVELMERTKVCACLNPLHTVLAIAGMLLRIPTIGECMQNTGLVALLKLVASENIRVIERPEIITPQEFLEDVVLNRLPIMTIPDTPARIASDTSQKVPVRFGMVLREYAERGIDMESLVGVPTFIALWLRYLNGVADDGSTFERSPDPSLPEVFHGLRGVELGQQPRIDEMLGDVGTFGVDLRKTPLGGRIVRIYGELMAGEGGVAACIAGFS